MMSPNQCEDFPTRGKLLPRRLPQTHRLAHWPRSLDSRNLFEYGSSSEDKETHSSIASNMKLLEHVKDD